MPDFQVLDRIDRSAQKFCITSDASEYLGEIDAIKAERVIEDHRLWALANCYVWLYGGGVQFPMTKQ
jgi:hypothetical protein